MKEIDEAIQHCLEVAEEQSRLYFLCPCPCDGTQDCMSLKNGKDMGCTKLAADHRQLAEWLTELADLKEEIEYCSGDINEMIAKAEAEERKCFNDVDISYNQGYIEGLREGEKYINRIKFKKEIQAELDKILNGNIVGIEIIDGLPE